MTKEFYKRLKNNPEAALNFVLLKLEALLEWDEKYPPLDWKYHIESIIEDFKGESHE